MSNVEVRLRVESGLKKQADIIFKNMGMSMSEAIRIFLMQSVNSDGLPFRPHLSRPNQITLKSFEQIDSGDFEEFSADEFSNYLKSVDNEEG